MLYIIGGRIMTMTGQIWDKGYLCIEKGKIRELGPMGQDCPFSLPADCRVIDAEGCIVMPGMIDAHCHAGIMEQNIGEIGNDCNENTDPVTPHLRAIDGINPLDPAFDDGVRAGVTSVMVGPGSSNVVGGQFTFMKTKKMKKGGLERVVRLDDLIVKNPAAMKVAFGENIKVNFTELNKSPVTRMAIAACLREELWKAKRYRRNKEKGRDDFEEDFRYECWLPVLNKEIPMKVHAHRADDIMTAVRIAREFDVDITLDHCSEGDLVADELAKAGYPAILGPGLGPKSKVETRNVNFSIVSHLRNKGIKTAICTDHPVTMLHILPLCAAYAVKEGLDMEEALKSITIYPAEICRVADRVGSLEKGKDGDVVVIEGNPLESMSRVRYTIIDGEIVYQV